MNEEEVIPTEAEETVPAEVEGEAVANEEEVAE